MREITVKEGFKGQRILSFPDESIREYLGDPFVTNLYISRIGFFPEVKYHYIEKSEGTDYSILVYCIKGKGWVKTGGKTYPVDKNQFFVLPHKMPNSFGAHNEDPWTIYWIHFKGKQTSSYMPVCITPQILVHEENLFEQNWQDLFEKIYTCLESGFIKENFRYACSCFQYLLSSFLYKQTRNGIPGKGETYKNLTEQILSYMKENITRQITLKELSEKFHISVSHLSFVFHKSTSYSVIDYFIRLKIQRACQYFELTSLKINEVAYLLGYNDVAYFSRLFSKVMKMSPKNYKLKSG
ncbi:MAG: AraC family transcriptional regulator [Bacteroides sp.]|nr:AraC family transcriptional regulator [Bacteroides sp.]